jgi:hypothetical protein
MRKSWRATRLALRSALALLIRDGRRRSRPGLLPGTAITVALVTYLTVRNSTQPITLKEERRK